MDLKRFWLPYATNENFGSKDGKNNRRNNSIGFKGN
jgi:hypothetical protein